jgi:hypothetical protein
MVTYMAREQLRQIVMGFSVSTSTATDVASATATNRATATATNVATAMATM